MNESLVVKDNIHKLVKNKKLFDLNCLKFSE